MIRQRRSLATLLAIVLLATLLAPPAAARSAADTDQPSLFVNLTSDELDRAAMAISLATRVRVERQIPVTLFLNVEGANLADRDRPQNTHSDGQTIHEMLAGLIAAGGEVLICPMCMRNVAGLEAADLLEGVVVGGSHVTLPAMLADGARILSY